MIVAVNKCNITSLVLEKLNKLKWGFSCKDNSCGIVENYLQYISKDCPTVIFSICFPDNCQNSAIVFNCNLKLIGITGERDVDQEKIVFDLGVGDYINGLPPFTYEWTYDEDIFDIISGSTTSPQIELQLKEDKQIELVITPIMVEITDSNGCTASKQCYLTPEGMQCANNYVPCNNPSDLEVTMIYITCSRPKSLTVELV